MLDTLLHETWVQVIVVIIAGLLIGLEIKAYRVHNDSSNEIGSVRTFSFIALISYIFAKIGLLLYIIGYIAILAHFALFYYFKLKNSRSGMLLFLLFTLVYSFGMIVVKFDIWFMIVVFVAIVFISNLNTKLEHFYKIFEEREIETFAKLLLLSAVILPLLPHTNIHKFVPVSYFKVWLAVVVVSMFSYVGYVLKKFFFKEKGYLLTGILGGIYSSTATTIVLAKKAAKNGVHNVFAASIIMATAFMYLRLLGITYAFNLEIAHKLTIPFLSMSVLTMVISFAIYKTVKVQVSKDSSDNEDKNPLELHTAFLFAFLFIAMAVITHFVLIEYGDIGLNVLSFIVGFTDIDPFVLSILSSKFNVTVDNASIAIMIAVGSNNILKALYAYVFSKNKAGVLSAVVLTTLGVATMAIALI